MPNTTIPKDFQAVFRDLVIAFQPRALERDTQRVYFEALGGLPIEDLRESAAVLRRTKGFFPTTGEWYLAAVAVQREAKRALASEPLRPDAVECDRCSDTGSVFTTCPGDTTCGRRPGHIPHDFVCVCSCRSTNQRYQRSRAFETLATTEPES